MGYRVGRGQSYTPLRALCQICFCASASFEYDFQTDELYRSLVFKAREKPPRPFSLVRDSPCINSINLDFG